MREPLCPFAAPLAAAALVAACATTGAAPRPEAPRTLRSERRLQFLVAEGATAADLRAAVAEEMTARGLPVADDERQAYDVEVRIALVPPGHATMWALLEGRVLDQWSVDPGAAAPADAAAATRALARDLVERLARSERVSGYADRLYGRRLRPLRETVGRRAFVPGDHGGTPPLESLGRAEDGVD
jgi:hypothetical protein